MATALNWLVDRVGGGWEPPLMMLTRVSLLLLLAWFAHFAWSKANPQIRVLMWRSTAVGLIAVLGLSQWSLGWRLPVLPPAAISTAASGVDPTTSAPVHVAPSLPIRRPDAGAPQIGEPAVGESPSVAVRSSVHPSTEASAGRPTSGPLGTGAGGSADALAAPSGSYAPSPAYAVGVWAVGFAVVAMRWLLGVLKLVFLYRGSTPATADMEEQARTIAAEIGYCGPIDIRCSDAIQTPCNIGAWRPRVLVPSRQCNPEERQELRASLAHELAHCKQHDLRWNHVLTLLQALLWFHPLAWRIRIAHADACDELCDAAAARCLGDHEIYSRMLARLAVRLASQQPSSALAMAHRSLVRRRIEAIGRNLSRRALRPWQTGGLVACAALASILLGTGALSRAEARTPQAEESGAGKSISAESTTATVKPSTEGVAQKPNPEAILPIRVTSKATGTPIPDAEIRFNGIIGGKRFDRRLETDIRGESELRRAASANVQNLWMTVKSPGHVPVHYVWKSDVKKVQLQERLDLELDPGLRIEGRIEDESGNPIPGASVELNMPITWPGLANYVFQAAERTTNEDGRWKWDGAPDDTASVSIRVAHPDYMDGGARAARGSGNTVTLRRGHQVRGRVVDASGKPVEGATAQLGLDRFGTGEPSAKTDKQGDFVITKCRPGPSAVTVQATGFSPEVVRITIGESTDDVELRLGPAHVLRGRVIDIAGKPLSGVLVAPDTWRGFRTLENRMTTDSEGRFEWNGAPSDAVEYSILKRGYMSLRDSALTATPDEQVITLYPELQVRGKVTDAKTGEPVREFAVRRGYLFAGRDGTSWSGDEGVPFRDGEFSFRIDEPMQGHVLQVVAPGYRPLTSRMFRSNEGSVRYNFALNSGKGPSGTVLTPEGEPAAGAEVGLATGEKRAFLNGGRFDRRQNRADVVAADQNGRFRFVPQDTEEFVLLVFHDAGFAEVTSAELASNGQISLTPWGKIRGQVMLGGKPDAGREVSYSPSLRDGVRMYDYVWSYGYDTKADEDGRFEFDHVVPGRGTLNRVLVTAFGKSWQHTPGWHTPVAVRANETTEATVGGTGKAVSGRLVLEREPDVGVDWTTNEPVTIELIDAKTGRRGETYARYASNIDANGAFSIPDVPPGEYKLGVSVNNPPQPNACGAGSAIGKAELVFSVPDEDDGDEAIELGTITATLFDTLDPGEVAPEFVAERLEGGTMRLSDYQGRLLVLDFWATWCGPCLAEMPTFQKLQAQFGDDPRFALVSLSCDNSPGPAREYVESTSLAWQHAHVSGTVSTTCRDYTVRSLPATFLIAPDGKVLAKNLRGDDLLRAVEASIKDDRLFTGKKEGRPVRFPVVRFEADQSSPLSGVPAVVVLDDVDPNFEKGQTHHDVLRMLDAGGNELWSQSGFNNAGTVGGVHRVVIDQKRGRVYVGEDVAKRLSAFSLSGSRLWQVEKVDAKVLCLDDQTGNLWCSGGPNLKSGETVVFDTQGNEVAAYPYRAIDMEFDPSSDAIWLTGYEVIKLNRGGDVVFRQSVEGWCCPSVSVNSTDGSVWIAERNHPDLAHSKNRLWLRDAAGKVLRVIELEDNDIYAVACDPRSGDAFFGGYNSGLQRVSVDGEPKRLGDEPVKNIAISRSGDIWVASRDAVFRIDENGKVMARTPFSAKSEQAWVAAF